MRILHTIGDLVLEKGGVARAVLDLATHTADAGHEVLVASWNAPDAPPGWRGDGSPRLISLQPPRMGRFTPADRILLQDAVRSCDVVHLHTPWEITNLGLASACRRLGKPYVLTMHGMLDDWCMAQKGWKKRLFLRLGGRHMLEHAAFVHTTAAAELEQSRPWCPRARCVVVPLVFDLDPYRSLPGPAMARDAFGIVPDVPVVLFLSRAHPKKGIEILIDATRALRDRQVPVQVLIAGTGDASYIASIESSIREAGLSEVVRLVGMVRGELKTSLYEAADVFALPTSQENFGLVLPEAMACRTPCITTKGVDIWPELTASGGAVIVEPTPEAFADAIEDLLRSPTELQEMGERARAWVFRELDPVLVRDRFSDLYRQAMDHKPPPSIA